MTEWFPIWKQLPETEDFVLVTKTDGDVQTAYYTEKEADSGEFYWADNMGTFIDGYVTAWMPLPEPYEED